MGQLNSELPELPFKNTSKPLFVQGRAVSFQGGVYPTTNSEVIKMVGTGRLFSFFVRAFGLFFWEVFSFRSRKVYSSPYNEHNELVKDYLPLRFGDLFQPSVELLVLNPRRHAIPLLVIEKGSPCLICLTRSTAQHSG